MAGNVKVRVTHPERVLFPADGITKGNVVSYYLAVAPAMVPHLRDRPANLQRFPGGIDEPGFFQQARPDYFPSWVPGAVVKKEGGRIEHPLIQTAAALAYVANQGCITPHVWLSRVDRIDRPDQLIFDLDPSEKILARVGEAARRVRELLAELGLTAFLKTTGSRGYHVTVPLDRRADFEAAREFAQAVAALLVRRHPALLTVEPRKADRGERIYIDTLRNAYGQTAVPPYAIRARPGAPVATPIAWDELGARGMRADRFTIRDVPSRLAAGIDPWRGWRRAARGVAGAARRLAAL